MMAKKECVFGMGLPMGETALVVDVHRDDVDGRTRTKRRADVQRFVQV